MRIILLLVFFLVRSNTLDFTIKNKLQLSRLSLSDIEYSPNLDILVVLDPNAKSVIVFTIPTFNQIQQVFLTISAVSEPNLLSFSHSGSLLAIGDDAGTVVILKKNGIKFQQTPISIIKVSDTHAILSLSFSNDDSILAIGDFNGFVTLSKIPNLINQYNMIPSADQTINFGTKVNVVAFDPQNGNLIVAGGDNSVTPQMYIYNSSNSFEKVNQIAVTTIVNSVIFLRNKGFGKQLLSTSQDGKITIWNVVKNKESNSESYQKAGELSPSPTTNSLFGLKKVDNQLYIVAIGNNQKTYIWQRSDQTSLDPSKWKLSSTILDNKQKSVALNKGLLSMISVQEQGHTQITEYSLCPIKTYYQSDSNQCGKCYQKCKQCYSPSGSSCYQCADGNYLQQNTCLSCLPGCFSCQKYQICDRCDQKGNWLPIGDGCQCNTGFFQLNDQCKSCSLGCLSCLSDEQCETCDISKQFVKNPDTLNCQCKQKYRLDSQTCLACGIGCLHCNSTTCLTCDIQSHFIQKIPNQEDCICDNDKFYQLNPISKRCECIKGYFNDPQSNSCRKCVKKYCSTCISQTQCIQCGSVQNTTIINRQCVCIDSGQFVDQDLMSCQNCNATVHFCTKCSEANKCVSCDTSKNRILINQSYCACDAQYFQNQQQECLPCSYGCLDCLSGQICQKCDQKNHWKLDKSTTKCFCQVGFLQNDSHCDKCSNPGCLKCQNTIYECVLCDQTKNWIKNFDQTCKCISSTFFDGKNSCLSCSFGCLNCINESTCVDCYPDFQFFHQQCHCSPGKYPINRSSCLNCILMGCKQCESAEKCTTCYPAYQIISDKCQCKQQKSFPDGNTCTSCVQPCQTCISIIECRSCIKGYYIQKLNSSCLQCTLQGCVDCTDQTTCKECYADYQLQNTTNVCICKKQTQYPNGKLCTDCISPCSTCLSEKICKSCIQGYFIDENQACLQCTLSQCKVCQSATECKQCLQGFVLNEQNICVQPDVTNPVVYVLIGIGTLSILIASFAVIYKIKTRKKKVYSQPQSLYESIT